MSAVSAEGTPASAGAADSVNTQKTVMPQIRRFSQLSPARQALVRLCQVVNFGEIQGIPVTDADPMFDDVCVVVIDAKLDKDEVPRPELGLVDFDLRADVCRLFSWLDEAKDGTMQRLEVRAGIPCRLVFGSALSKLLGTSWSSLGNKQKSVG
jgi:hypothetical protein